MNSTDAQAVLGRHAKDEIVADSIIRLDEKDAENEGSHLSRRQSNDVGA